MKNRSERNKDFETLAQTLFKDKKILVERPPEMDYEEYRLLRTQQTLILKFLFHKGNSPNRRLQGVMGTRTHSSLPTTAKGFRRQIKQRKSS